MGRRPIFPDQTSDRYNVAIDEMLEAEQPINATALKSVWSNCAVDQMAKGEKPRYDGRCRHSHEHHADDEPCVVRLLTRRTETVILDDDPWPDRIQQSGAGRYLIIRRTDGSPTWLTSVWWWTTGIWKLPM